MGINKERILIFEKLLDRINRIVRIDRMYPYQKKYPVNPVNPV